MICSSEYQVFRTSRKIMDAGAGGGSDHVEQRALPHDKYVVPCKVLCTILCIQHTKPSQSCFLPTRYRQEPPRRSTQLDHICVQKGRKRVCRASRCSNCSAASSRVHSYFFCQLEQLDATVATATPGFGGRDVASSPVAPFALTVSRYFSVTTAMASRP